MNPKDVIHPSWNPVLGMLYQEPLTTLNNKVLHECAYNPELKNVFKVFSMPVHQIKVVILGQDPYPNPKFAMGYAFAVPPTVPMPKSLQVIEQEVINSDPSNMNGSGEICLHSWIDQGIFLLNTALTVERGKSGSHIKYWQPFISKVVGFIARTQPCIWLLWGSKAQQFTSSIPKKNMVNVNRYNRQDIENVPASSSLNYVLTAPHPISEVYGSGKYYGSDHFYKVNRILSLKKEGKIKW